MPSYALADPAVSTFIVIAVCVAALFIVAVSRVWPGVVVPIALGVAAWMGATAVAAQSGVLRQWDANPPPFMLLVVAITVLTVAVIVGPLGRRLATLPLWLLVAVQAFRLPLELAMHRMYEVGINPVQMSYSGRNFDILTGITALIVAPLVASGRAGRGLVLAWNVVGLLLVLNVVTIGILSTPRFRLFGDDQLNVWVTYFPFVWLPAVMVLAAFIGHGLIFRAVGKAT